MEPKKKKAYDASQGSLPTSTDSAAASRIDRSKDLTSVSEHQNLSEGTLRRSRIVITVKRTEAYVKWLKENPIQDIHHSGDDHDRI